VFKAAAQGRFEDVESTAGVEDLESALGWAAHMKTRPSIALELRTKWLRRVQLDLLHHWRKNVVNVGDLNRFVEQWLEAFATDNYAWLARKRSELVAHDKSVVGSHDMGNMELWWEQVGFLHNVPAHDLLQAMSNIEEDVPRHLVTDRNLKTAAKLLFLRPFGADPQRDVTTLESLGDYFKALFRYHRLDLKNEVANYSLIGAHANDAALKIVEAATQGSEQLARSFAEASNQSFAPSPPSEENVFDALKLTKGKHYYAFHRIQKFWLHYKRHSSWETWHEDPNQTWLEFINSYEHEFFHKLVIQLRALTFQSLIL